MAYLTLYGMVTVVYIGVPSQLSAHLTELIQLQKGDVYLLYIVREWSISHAFDRNI